MADENVGISSSPGPGDGGKANTPRQAADAAPERTAGPGGHGAPKVIIKKKTNGIPAARNVTAREKTSETPVRDMARALHDKIKKYGVKAVWDGLDPRFKASGGEKLEGIKTREKTRITFRSFEKGYERLLAEQKTAENMNFGIRGNPLLLSNVFKILGIKGFEDLAGETFAVPNPNAKLFSIDSKVDDLRELIENLDEKLETHIRRRSRITALKAASDFDSISKRLTGILENNSDDFIDASMNVNNMKRYNEIWQMINNPKHEEITNRLEFLRYIEETNKREKGDKRFRSLLDNFFKKQSGEDKRVLYFYWIIHEYSGYCFFLHPLRDYYRLINGGNDFISSADSGAYVMSPLYISLLYLTIASQYIKKAGTSPDTALNRVSDKAVADKIRQTHPDLADGRQNITKSKYYELMTARLIKQISRIVKLFSPCDISPWPKLYEKYKEILGGVLSVYRKALTGDGEPSLEETAPNAGAVRNIRELFSIWQTGLCGRFRIDTGIIGEFDVLLNDLSNTAQFIQRNRNG